MSTPERVARFNGMTGVAASALANILRSYPDAIIRVSDGWVDVHSDELPADHPINVLADVVQVAWERGAITDTRFNEASAAVETLRERA